MIAVEPLPQRYAGFTAVDNVFFTALPGRVTGLLGSNGTGKCTTMRVMFGLTVPTSATALLGAQGCSWRHRPPVQPNDGESREHQHRDRHRAARSAGASQS